MPHTNPPLTVTDALVEEFTHVHGPVDKACDGTKETLDQIARDLHRRPHDLSGSPGSDETRLSALFQAVEQLKEPRSALCLSGGGIRSATFSLGVMQAFARWGVLGRFHYLSTVSGGGYIGSWLSTWIRRCGFDEVMKALGRAAAVEPGPLRHLRTFSNYLAPRRGLSTDSVTLVAIFLRNLFLNWIVIVPLLVAILAVPRLWLTALWLPNAGDLYANTNAGRWLLAGAPQNYCDWARWGWMGLGVAVCIAVGMIALVTAQLPSMKRDAARPRAGELFRRLYVPGLMFGALALVWSWAALAVCSQQVPPLLPRITWPSVHKSLLLMLSAVGIHVAGIAIGTAVGLRVHRHGNTVTKSPTERADDYPLKRAPVKAEWSVGEIALDLVAILLSGAGAGAAIWFGAARIFPEPGKDLAMYGMFAVPYVLACYWLGTTLYVGFFSRRTPEDDREWWARAGALSIKISLGWIGLFALVVYGPPLLVSGGLLALGAIVAAGGVSGVATALGGYWSESGMADPSEQSPKWRALLARWGLPAGAILFLVVLVVGLSALTSVALAPSALHAGWDNVQPESEPAGKLAKSVATLGKYFSSYKVALKGERNEAKDTGGDPEPTPPVAAPVPPRATPVGPPGATTVLDAASKTVASQSPADQAKDEEEKNLVRSYLHSASAYAAGAASYGKALETFHMSTTASPSPEVMTKLILGTLGCALMSLLGSFFVGANRFSLHSMYGNRLVRAYLGASNLGRHPDVVTGFDPDDNVLLADLVRRPPGNRLFHVLGAALNLTTGTRTEWQQRQAATFTMSPLHSGSPVTGYRRTESYGDPAPGIGLSLGKAMTISGAAVSPAMGYRTSGPVAFVMEFFNVRLGWWLPNPGSNGAMNRSEPIVALPAVVKELAGSVDDGGPDVYLSDGGHFDNLGLYEMVRRRCRVIVAVDTGQDAGFTYEDLAGAIRKIRTDLGITIDFADGTRPEPGKAPTHRYTLGRIGYPESPDRPGYLVYVKPVMLAGTDNGAPLDVRHFDAIRKEAGATFPHEPTTDQFFDEAQFESYRMLGFVTGEAIQKDLEDVDERSIQRRWNRDDHEPIAGAPPPAASASATTRTSESAGRKQNGTGDGPRLERIPTWLLGSTALSSALAVGVAVTVTGTISAPPIAVQPAKIVVSVNDEQYPILKRLVPESDKDTKSGIVLSQTTFELLNRLASADPDQPSAGQPAVNGASAPRGLLINTSHAKLLDRLSSKDAAGDPIDGIQLNPAAKKAFDLGIGLSAKALEQMSAEKGGVHLNKADAARLLPEDGLHLNKDALTRLQQGLDLSKTAMTTIERGIGFDPAIRIRFDQAIEGLRQSIRTASAEQVGSLKHAIAVLEGIEKEVGKVQAVGPRRNVHGTKGD